VTGYISCARNEKNITGDGVISKSRVDALAARTGTLAAAAFPDNIRSLIS
jgi:hypothetical protein